MLKQSVAVAAIFTALAAQATSCGEPLDESLLAAQASESVEIPYYDLNTSANEANGTVAVTPRGYVVYVNNNKQASGVHVLSCVAHTKEVAEVLPILDRTIDLGFRSVKKTDTPGHLDKTTLTDIHALTGGMAFINEQCQNSKNPADPAVTKTLGTQLEAINRDIKDLIKLTPQ